MSALRYTSRQHQQLHVANWRLSGLSRAQYARLHHLSSKSLSRWVTTWTPPAPPSTPESPFIPVALSSEDATLARDGNDPVTLNLMRCSITCVPGQLRAIMTELDLC